MESISVYRNYRVFKDVEFALMLCLILLQACDSYDEVSRVQGKPEMSDWGFHSFLVGIQGPLGTVEGMVGFFFFSFCLKEARISEQQWHFAAVPSAVIIRKDGSNNISTELSRKWGG